MDVNSENHLTPGQQAQGSLPGQDATSSQDSMNTKTQTMSRSSTTPLVNNTGGMLDSNRANAAVKIGSKSQNIIFQEGRIWAPKASPLAFTVAPIQPSMNLRKQVQRFPEKDGKFNKLNFEAGARILALDVGPVVSQATVSMGLRQEVLKTNWGKIRARLNIFSRIGFHGTEIAEKSGYNIGLFTDFDRHKHGNFEVTQKQVQYQRCFPAYVRGPFKGTGCTVRLGAVVPFNGRKPRPIIDIEDLKVKANTATLTTGVVAAVVFLVLKPSLSFNVRIPFPPKVPLLDFNNATLVGVRMGESQGKSLAEFHNLANFQWTVPDDYQRK